jgi:hypothetical protein
MDALAYIKVAFRQTATFDILKGVPNYQKE